MQATNSCGCPCCCWFSGWAAGKSRRTLPALPPQSAGTQYLPNPHAGATAISEASEQAPNNSGLVLQMTKQVKSQSLALRHFASAIDVCFFFALQCLPSYHPAAEPRVRCPQPSACEPPRATVRRCRPQAPKSALPEHKSQKTPISEKASRSCSKNLAP